MHDIRHNSTKVHAAPSRHASEGRELTSKHVLNLVARMRQDAPRFEQHHAPRGFGYFKHILDERLHLRDLRHRRLSTHHLDWKDFPPKGARTLTHAVTITIRRFFTEHPLADLTVFTVVHLAAVIVARLIVHPIERLAALRMPKRAPVSAIRIMPPTPVAPAVPKPHNVHGVAPSFGMLGFAFALPAGWRKNMLGFAAAASLVVLPLGAYDDIGSLRVDRSSVIERATAAVTMLKAAQASAMTLDFASAGIALDAAAKDFGAAREALGGIGSLMNAAADALPIEIRLTSAGPLLLAGEEATIGGAVLASGLARIDNAKSPMEKLRLARTAIDSALPHFQLASRAIGNVAPGIAPEHYRDNIELAKRELPKLAANLQAASDAAATIEVLLGATGTKRYLLAFQNNSELRPTGGFIGSFALLDVKDGKVEKMEIPGGGSYDLQGSLGLRLNAPQPLRLINPRWEFQDANWYPDFPTSAKVLSRFYEKSGGPTVDGVIAINATFMEDLLAATGPIEMPEYGKTISAQNFFYETQKQVELDYDKAENKPKQFIADLAPKMITRLMDADRATLISLAGLLSTGLTEKELLVWTRDTAAQERLASFGWDGAIHVTDGDYLAVVHTNIAGQKTDLAMREKIQHAAKVLPDGETVVTLTIERSHTGQEGALFSGVRNVDYLRVYVPKGSELVEAKGFTPPDPKLFSIIEPGNRDDAALAAQESGMRTDRTSGTTSSEEQGHTVFGNWVQTDPGETSVVTLVYRLPPGTARIEDRTNGGLAGAYERLMDSPRKELRYSLHVQKQPGQVPPEFISLIDLPRTFVPIAAAPTRQTDERGRLVSSHELRSDTSFDVIAESQ